MLKQIGVIILSSVILFTQVSSVTAGTVPVPPKDANLFVQQEVALSTLGLVATLVGKDNSILPWSGKISRSHWTYNVRAPYRDGHLILHYRGTLHHHKDVITWKGRTRFTNQFGSLLWHERGSYTDATVDGFFRKFVKVVAKAAVATVAVAATLVVGGTQITAGAASCTPPATASCIPVATGLFGASALAISGITKGAGAAFDSIDKSLPDENGNTMVTSSQQLSSLNLPFKPPFPIRIPGLLQNPEPNYPPVFTSLISRFKNFINPIVSVSGNADVTAGGLLVNVDGVDAIFFAGRTDVSPIPLPNGDPNAFILIRHDHLVPEFPLTESLPPLIPVTEGAVVRAISRATGGVSFFQGFDGPIFGPDGNEGSESILSGLGAISGYQGPEGALVGVFLDDAIPNNGVTPAPLDFTPSGLGTNFDSLSPALEQVFFIGDGFRGAGEAQQFIAPPGATRLALGIPDGFGFNGQPGAYEDNNGAYGVRIRVINP